jgi:hypothetical protein
MNLNARTAGTVIGAVFVAVGIVGRAAHRVT